MNKRTLKRIGSRTGQSVVTILVACTLVFLLIHLVPGDPVLQILGTEASPERAEALRAELNLDVPLGEQYVTYMSDLAHGDLGNSLLKRSSPVSAIIFGSVGSTLTIAILGLSLGIIIGAVGGIWGAVSRVRAVDTAVQTFAILAYATPTFLFALILILIVSLSWNLLPAGGWPGEFPQNFLYAILPATALGVNLAPKFLRPVRQGAIDTQNTLFIESAISRGISRFTLVRRHIFPNSILPLITLVGISLGGLLTNAVIVEAVFGIPGLGTELSKAVSQRDYPVIQGITLIMSITVILGNLLAEVTYEFVDPRARI